MIRQLIVRSACALNLNLNWLFDPAESWRRGEPLIVGRNR